MGIWEIFCLIGWGMGNKNGNDQATKDHNRSNFWDWVGIWLVAYVCVFGWLFFLCR
jgi:hypothetical protein